MTKLFNSDVDLRVLIIRLSPVLLYLVSIFIFKSFITTLPLLVPCFFTLFQLVRTNYSLTKEGHLVVTFGFSKLKVDINDIKSIVFKNSLSFANWFHTYANSKNGLLVSYGRSKEIFISPKDKEGFMTEIEKSKQRS